MADRGAAPAERARYPRGEGGRLRGDILDAATALLDETGEAGAVTLRAVARRVGITAPAIYPHFRDPQAILLAVVSEEFARLREYLRAAVESASADPVDRLRAWCVAYLDHASTQPRRYLVLFGGVWDAGPAVRDEVVEQAEVGELGRDALEDLADLLRRCVEDGRSSSADADADAVLLWVGLHGLAHQRIVSRAFPWPPALDDRMIERLGRLVTSEGPDGCRAPG